MASKNDPALAARPDLFAVERSVPRTVVYAATTVACAIGLLLTIVFFNQIHAEMMQYTGRRSAFRALGAPGLVALAAFLTGSAVFGLFTDAHRWVFRPTGNVLKAYERKAQGDEAMARQWHAAIQYDPRDNFQRLKSNKGKILIRFYREPAASTTFATVTSARRGQDWGLPVIPITGEQYDALYAKRR